MFADATKDPIPSVLNLNPGTASVSNTLIAMSGNLQLGLLINKIPFIEQATREVAISESAAQTADTLKERKSVSRLLKQNIINPGLENLKSEDRLNEIFTLDDDGNPIYGAWMPMYIETTTPDAKLVTKNAEDVSLEDVGFVLHYSDSSVVSEDVAKIYMAQLYSKIGSISGDIIKVGKILNFIKSQTPDFSVLDKTLDDVDYLLSGDSVFGYSIVDIIEKSNEFQPLIKAAKAMSDYSEDILIERTRLFMSMNKVLQSGFTNTYNQPNAAQNISDQITKYIIVNRCKVDLENKLAQLEGKTDNTSNTARTLYQESLKYFTSDFWLNNNTLLDDLDYLYQANPGNPFVEFLKVNVNKNINYLEASTRMKLDKDITENIINGYEALQKSKDDKSNILSKQMFYYLIVKDGLGYGANTFIGYLNPDLKQFKQVSDSLSEFKGLLDVQQEFVSKSIKEAKAINNDVNIEPEYKKQLIQEIADKIHDRYNTSFDTFFNDKKSNGNKNWIDTIVTKIFTNAANQKYISQVKGPSLIFPVTNKKTIDKFIKNGVFSHIKKEATGDRFDYLEDAGEKFDIDFTNLKGTPTSIEETFVFRSFNINMDDDENIMNVVYPVLIANETGKLYKLASVDGVSTSKEKARSAILGGSGSSMIGLKATYYELKVEGTNKIGNFGFNSEDGNALYKHTQNIGKESEENIVNRFMTHGISSDNIPPHESLHGFYGEPIEIDGEDFEIPEYGEINMGDIEEDADFERLQKLYNEKQNNSGIVNRSADELSSTQGLIIPGAVRQAYEKSQSVPVTPTDMGPVNTTPTANRTFTPEYISKLGPKDIFVFGSNTEGRHGLGAAKTAKDLFGAVNRQPEGRQGQSYAIVTKNLTAGAQLNGITFENTGKRSVPIEYIGKGVQDMLQVAKLNPTYTFYVTKIGTENAGYSVAEMKGIFEKLKNFIPDNVILPKEFEVRASINTETADSQTIMQSEVKSIYAEKAAVAQATGQKILSEDKWMADARSAMSILKSNGYTKQEILEQLKCL